MQVESGDADQKAYAAMELQTMALDSRSQVHACVITHMHSYVCMYVSVCIYAAMELQTMALDSRSQVHACMVIHMHSYVCMYVCMYVCIYIRCHGASDDGS